MTLTAWLSLLAVCVLGALSPGPSLVVVLKHSISSSTRHGIIAAISHGIGVGLYAIGALIGLVSVLKNLPILYQILVYSGATYLCYMGVKALCSKGDAFDPDLDESKKASLWTAAQDGFAIAFLNPKLAVFFVALFSQFINPDALSFQSGAIMVGTVFFIDTFWYCIVAIMVHYARERFALKQKNHIINKITGVVFIGLAIRVVTL